MTLSIFKELPNEIWLNILQFSDHTIDTVRKLTIIRPELFHLTISGFDVWIDSYDDLYFKELYDFQTQNLLSGETGQGRIHLNEFMKSTLKPNFRNLKPQELKVLARADYCVFTSVDDLVEDGSSLRMVPSVVQKNRYPKAYQFPILKKLILHCTKQTIQRTSKASLMYNLNDAVFPNLNELAYEGNSNVLCIEDIKLTSLETLGFAGQALISGIRNVDLPNLATLTLDCGRRFHSHADNIPDLQINDYLSFIDANEMPVKEQIQRGLIKYTNPNFDQKLNLPNLKAFEFNISLIDIEAIKIPNHLYFFDVIPFEQLEEFKFQLEDPYVNAQSRTKNSPADIILQITQCKLVEILPRCTNLKKLSITSAIGNNYNCDDIIEILPQFTNLQELELDTIYASKIFKPIELPNLKKVTLKYASYSEYLSILAPNLKSMNVTFFPFSVDIFNSNPGKDTEPSTVEYLNSFQKLLPVMDTLTIDMYTPYWAYREYAGDSKPPYIFTRRRHLVELDEIANLRQLKSIHLVFNFQELFNFFKTSNNYKFEHLEKLQLHGWFDDFENTSEFTNNITTDILAVADKVKGSIELNVNAPNLKQLIGHFSKQAVIETESPFYKALASEVKALRVPYFPKLEETVLMTSHSAFAKVMLSQRNQEQGLRIRALKWFSPFKAYEEKPVAVGDNRYKHMLDVIWYDDSK